MFERLDNLKGLTIHALDGELGRVEEFRFDEERWTVRYLVVSTGRWLGREVLVSPIFVGPRDWASGRIEVRLTRDRIRNSPQVPPAEAFTRDEEAMVAQYFGIPIYWNGPYTWGSTSTPALPVEAAPAMAPQEGADPTRGATLRSQQALRGLHLQARDGEIGHVDDAFVDDGTWRLRYLLVDTSNWLGGTWVLVPVETIERVDWRERRLLVAATTDRIRSAPPHDPERPLDSTTELALERHYGSSGPGPTPGRAAARQAKG